MTLGHGPKIITNGLVFAYDMGPNPGANKSWKGKPTTNYLNGSTSGTYPDAFQVVSYAGDGARAEIGTSQFGTKIIQWTATGSTYIYTRDEILDDDLATLSGQTVTFSLYIRRLEGSATGRIRVYDDISSYSYQSVSVTSVFQRVEMTKTLGANPTRIFVMLDNTGGGTYQFHSPQLEISSFATPFTYSSRSTTQALLDWAGGNTITLNGMQYNSDGTFQTSGATTTDYISIANGALSAQASSGNWTIDFWLKMNARNSSLDHILQTGSANNFLWYLIGSVLHFQNTAETTVTLPTISTNTWFNLTMTGSGGSVQVYKDGSYVGAMTNTTTFSIASTIGIIMGQEMDSNSGGFAATQSFQGYYGSTRFYNRPLSAAEVQQNFQALRGRYGL
jgi:hypothetical protein